MFGLPAHPLFVHAAVVLVPLSAIAFVGLVWRRRWRETYLLPIMVLAIAGAVSTFISRQTGHLLEDAMSSTGIPLGEHPAQGNTAFLFACLYGVGCFLTYILYEYGYELRSILGIEDRFHLPVDDDVAAYLLVIPVAILAVLTIVVAGHSGSSLAWKDFP